MQTIKPLVSGLCIVGHVRLSAHGAAGTGFSDSDSSIYEENNKHEIRKDQDLEGIDVAGAIKSKATEYGQSSPGGDEKALDAKAVRNLDENKGKGGLLCCLFFKKVVVN